MMRSGNAGVAYFLIAFTAGFLIGAVRVTLLVPQLGMLGAVLIELPIMLAISWVTCRWVIARYAVADTMIDRLAMGAVAFALLMVAELGLSVMLFNQTVMDHLITYTTAAGGIGLSMQIAFALFPLIQRTVTHREPNG